MALKATIYKAELQLADVDHHRYDALALTIARHPSETDERMMVRVLMYALYARDGIAQEHHRGQLPGIVQRRERHQGGDGLRLRHARGSARRRSGARGARPACRR